MNNTRRMNIFGDDESELDNITQETKLDSGNSDNEDPTVFYQDVKNDTTSNTSSNRNTRTNRRSQQDFEDSIDEDDELNDNYSKYHWGGRSRHFHLNKRKEMQDRYYNTSVNNRHNAFRGYHNQFNHGYESYRGSTPSFSKEDNAHFINQILTAILIIMALVFIFRSESAYAGVTAVILIIVIMGNITKKKGNNRK